MPESFRILILEDNPADAELIQFELQEAGFIFTPNVVMTEEDFVGGLQDYCPDLILSDYDLPKYNGALALAEASRRCPDTPFILVTGAVTEDRAIEILTQGAKDYVLKTRLQQRLIPAVQRALAEAKEHKARKQAEAELREAYRTLEERVKIRTAEIEAEIAARKKSEEALRDSERRERERAEELSTILDAIPTPVIIVHDPDATHMTGNHTADELLHQPRGAEVSLSAPAEVKPRHFKAMKDGRELRLDELPAQRAARGEHVQNFEFSLAFNDGTTCNVLGYGTPLLDKQGRPRGAVHALVDITERKRAEESLRKSESYYRDLFNSMQEGFYIAEIIYDGDGKPQDYIYLDINPVFERIMGLSRDQIIGKRLKELLPDVSSHWLDIFRRVAMTGAPTRSEFYSKSFHRYFNAMAYKTSEGQFAVLVEDITERKQADERITRLASFPMLNPNPIIEVDFAGVAHFCNPAAERLFPDFRQREREHPLLADWEAIVRSFCEGGVKESTRELIIHERCYQETIHFVEEAERIRIYANDITLRKEAEKELVNRAAQLEIANQELESFSYSVSHDLLAPLRAIDGYSRMILRNYADTFNEDIRSKFNVIRDNVRMMGQLIQDLLAFSRLGRTTLSVGKIDAERMIKEAWEELKAVNPGRHMTLKIASLPPCMGDQGLIKQVFANLLANAVKFTKPREEALIEVEGDVKGSECLYYVRDNGVGFDMEYHDKMFGVFQRLHSNEDFEGTGVGLAIVQRIINRHNGKIWAEGAVDKGATFYFMLPAQQE